MKENISNGCLLTVKTNNELNLVLSVLDSLSLPFNVCEFELIWNNRKRNLLKCY